MKKSIFILVALFAATFANAQITLEHTFNTAIYELPYAHDSKFRLLGDVFRWSVDGETYVADANTYATIVLPKSPMGDILCVSKGYFTTDNRICFIVSIKNDQQVGMDDYAHIYLYDEYGDIIQDLGTCMDADCCFFLLNNGKHKLRILKRYTNNLNYSEIYSLPGNGEAQAITTTSSPKRSSFARKIAREGKVLVESDNSTYTLTGQEVK